MTRKELLTEIATEILTLPTTNIRRVAVDGVDGAGKTHLADELAAELTSRGTPVIRASTDSFHNPAKIRHHKGRNSPEGFFQDSYNYEELISKLLTPLSPSGTGTYTRQIYDIETETRKETPPERAAPNAILIFDGIFTHRDELTKYWDYSIWLAVPFTVSIPRVAQRAGLHPDPTHSSNHRYTAGQELYMATCNPASKATVQIDNTNLATPTRK
jgi:uridine kinase